MNIVFTNNIIRIFMGLSLINFLILSAIMMKSDISSQKIPNKLIIVFLIIAGVLYSSFLAFGFFTKDSNIIRYVQLSMINFAIAVAFGYILWYVDLWSPGDGKYFPTAVLFIPLYFYRFQYIPNFPSFVILINSYIIAFIFLFLYAGFQILRNAHKQIFSEGDPKENFKKLFMERVKKLTDRSLLVKSIGMIFYFLSLILMIGTISSQFGKIIHIPSASFMMLSMVILYLLFRKLAMFLMTNRLAFTTSILIFIFIVMFDWFIFNKNMIAEFTKNISSSIFIIVFVPIARYVIDKHSLSTDMITVETLEKGMSLSPETAKFLKTLKDIDIPSDTPLSQDYVQAIKDNFPNVTFLQKTSYITFGPFIFAGCLFIMIFGKTILHFIQMALK